MGELMAYYRSTFLLRHKFEYKIGELDDMLPFERDIYMLMLQDQLKKDSERK